MLSTAVVERKDCMQLEQVDVNVHIFLCSVLRCWSHELDALLQGLCMHMWTENHVGLLSYIYMHLAGLVSRSRLTILCL